MNKTLLKNTLIVLLLAIALFSIIRYILSIKEVSQAKEQVAILEIEKQNLLQELEKEKELQQNLTKENSGLKDNIKASRRRLTKLFREVKDTQKAIEDLNSRFSILKAENTALIEEESILKLKLSQVSQENDSMKVKLSSVAELKQAIRELKIKMRQSIVNQYKKLTQIVEGNRGYIIKDGKSTYPAKIKIEVRPAPANE